jgi:hypothetical protein
MTSDTTPRRSGLVPTLVGVGLVVLGFVFGLSAEPGGSVWPTLLAILFIGVGLLLLVVRLIVWAVRR